jgi:PAS domain S-box-containing protein
MRPHLEQSSPKPQRIAVNLLFLLFFWAFLYAYLLFPYQYLFWDTKIYNFRYNLLYLVENLALVVTLAVLTLRAAPPWKSIYRHLLGACALYTLSSAVANFAIDSRGFDYTSLYALAADASACWFVWVPLRARQLPQAEIRVTEPDTRHGKYTSLFAMLTVVAISLVGVWDLYQQDQSPGLRRFRLLMALIFVVFLAFAVFLKEYVANRELSEMYDISQVRLAGIIASAMDAIIVVDNEQRIVLFNAAAEKMFGYPAHDAIGNSIERFIPQGFRAQHDAHVRRFGETGVANRAMGTLGALWGQRANGEEIPIETSISQVEADGRKLFTAIIRDVTERRRAEDAVRESEQRFRLVANTAPVLIWMSGCDKLCNYFNQSWLDFTGRPLEVELGNGWAEGVHPEDFKGCLDTYSHAFDRRGSFQMQYRLRRHDGEYRWVSDIGVPRFNPDGSFAGYIGSCVDITDQKRTEEALADMGRRLIEAHEEERTWIARELHDDVNQRIALLAIELGKWDQNLPESVVEVHDHIRQVSQRLSEIGKDIQALSHRLHSSKLEYLGIAVAASSFCKELSEQQKVEIDFSHAGIPHNVPNEVSLCLFRVLQEALQNAVKHSDVRLFSVELRGNAEEIQLTVSDLGIGFDQQDVMKRHGLGVISMRERLKLVNGEFSIKSEPGGGTTVNARVPLRNLQFPKPELRRLTKDEATAV